MRPSIGDILKGLGVGAASGGLATGIETYLVMFVVGPFTLNPPPTLATIAQAIVVGLAIIPVAAVVAGLTFLVGLVVVGIPAWAALHAVRLRSRWAAAIAGAMLAPASVWACGPWDVTASNFSWVPLGLVLPGAVAGWTVHRLAYGASKPSRPQPQELPSHPV